MEFRLLQVNLRVYIGRHMRRGLLRLVCNYGVFSEALNVHQHLLRLSVGLQLPITLYVSAFDPFADFVALAFECLKLRSFLYLQAGHLVYRQLEHLMTFGGNFV